MDLIHHLDTSEAITIGTQREDGRVVETLVGVVVVDDAGYVRSEKRAKGKWYQRALRRPDGYVVDGTERHPVIFRHVTDAGTIRRVDEATYRKYGGVLRSFLLRPLVWQTRAYVVKITPRGGSDAGSAQGRTAQ